MPFDIALYIVHHSISKGMCSAKNIITESDDKGVNFTHLYLYSCLHNSLTILKDPGYCYVYIRIVKIDKNKRKS